VVPRFRFRLCRTWHLVQTLASLALSWLFIAAGFVVGLGRACVQLVHSQRWMLCRAATRASVSARFVPVLHAASTTATRFKTTPADEQPPLIDFNDASIAYEVSATPESAS
jgi:hypothetical protein